MKKNVRALEKQREMLDRKLRDWREVRNDIPPRNGWIKAIRESLGMTATQLARRLKTSQPSVAQLESREPTRKVTLEMLDRAAAALGCRVVYALVPADKQSLFNLLENQAREFAQKKMEAVSHSMGLENQSLNQYERLYQVRRIAKELIENLDSQIWEISEEKTPK